MCAGVGDWDKGRLVGAAPWDSQEIRAGEKEGCFWFSTEDGGDWIWRSREKSSAGSLPGFLFLSYVVSLIIPNISHFRVFSSQFFVASV